MHLLCKVLEEVGCDEKIQVFKAYEGRIQSDTCVMRCTAQKGSRWCHFITTSGGITGPCYSWCLESPLKAHILQDQFQAGSILDCGTTKEVRPSGSSLSHWENACKRNNVIGTPAHSSFIPDFKMNSLTPLSAPTIMCTSPEAPVQYS